MSIYGAQSTGAPRFDDEARSYDALLVLSFGGPEGPDDVIPFLENVTRGRNIPRERLLEVAEHYLHFGGVSPINEQNRALIAALETELAANEIELPIYFGNRNWEPFVTATVERMRTDGVKRALVLVTSALVLIREAVTTLIRGATPGYVSEPYMLCGTVELGKMRYVGRDEWLKRIVVAADVCGPVGVNQH